MVIGGRQGALHQMTENVLRRCSVHTAIFIVVLIVVTIRRLREISRQHIEGLLII